MVSVDRGEGFAVVTLQRPEKRNALSIELRFELAGELDRVAADEAIGCAVLTGAGSAFSSGMDTTQFGGDEENRRRLVESSERMFGTVGRFPSPFSPRGKGTAPRGGLPSRCLGADASPPPRARPAFRGPPRRPSPPAHP